MPYMGPPTHLPWWSTPTATLYDDDAAWHMSVHRRTPLLLTIRKNKINKISASGLVGQAIKAVVEESPDAYEGQNWVFLSSKDADLT